VRFRAGGVRFAVGPDSALLPAEREAISRLDPDPDDDTQAPTRVELVGAPPWTSDDAALFPRWEPAVQRWSGGRLLCSHRSFTAEVDPFSGTALLHRREERVYPLEAVIRTTMMARLPLLGGLPLHAAGVVVAGGRGVALFGPSGAGKTTVASTSPYPVLSDELVAVVPGQPFDLVRSGFWGEAGEAAVTGPAPLALLLDLAKGPAFRLARLRPAEAVGRLLASVPVPLVPPLWSRALATAAALVREVPVHRMEWTPAEPPWERLAGVLGRTPPGTDRPSNRGGSAPPAPPGASPRT
jgi:hypothetical protein